jgi:hypothetical protein
MTARAGALRQLRARTAWLRRPISFPKSHRTSKAMAGTRAWKNCAMVMAVPSKRWKTSICVTGTANAKLTECYPVQRLAVKCLQSRDRVRHTAAFEGGDDENTANAVNATEMPIFRSS